MKAAEGAASGYGAQLLAAEKKRAKRTNTVLRLLLAAAVLGALLAGRYEMDAGTVAKALLWGAMDGVLYLLELPAKLLGLSWSLRNPLPDAWDQMSLLVMWSLRIPRVLGAFLVGGGLAVTGAAYQGVFRNPLVSESILGVSAGASLGAVVAVVLSLGRAGASLLAFAGALLAVLLTWLVSRAFKGNPAILLVLAGTVVGSLFSAVFTLVQYTLAKDGNFQDGRIRELLFWLMGSLADIQPGDLLLLGAGIGACYLALYRMRWKLNLLSLGEEEARALGLDTRRARLVLIGCSTLIAALSVSICGMIGWVGLIVPQAVRIVLGPDNRRLIPCAFLTGGLFLIAADIVSRALLLFEIPIGVVTAVVGTPIFLFLLTKLCRGWAE